MTDIETASRDTSASNRTLAFAALVAGNVAIAFGPLLVRYADTGPIATGFWRMALAVPFLALFGYRAGFRFSHARPAIYGLTALAGFFFASSTTTTLLAASNWAWPER